jgi:hypothetical protein
VRGVAVGRTAEVDDVARRDEHGDLLLEFVQRAGLRGEEPKSEVRRDGRDNQKFWKESARTGAKAGEISSSNRLPSGVGPGG